MTTQTPEFMLYGEIGDDPLFGIGISARQLANFLAANKGAPELRVRIHSPGGDLDQALAMHNLMIACESEITVEVDGYAMSAASIVMMGGDKRRCAANALLMIHEGRGGCRGTAESHRSFADFLDKANDSMAVTYAQRTSLSKEKARKMMADETYMNAEEALKDGFVTEVTEARTVEASWDLSKLGYVRAQQYVERITKRAPAAAPVGSSAPATPIAAFFCNSSVQREPLLTRDEEAVRKALGISVEKFIAGRDGATAG